MKFDKGITKIKRVTFF